MKGIKFSRVVGYAFGFVGIGGGIWITFAEQDLTGVIGIALGCIVIGLLMGLEVEPIEGLD